LLEITTEPLTPEAFAPYGFVVSGDRTDVVGKSANQGTATRFNWLGAVEDRRPGKARLNLCIFRCSPRVAWPLRVEILEKHPKTTQVLVPMNANRYVVLVASPGGDMPDLSTLRAFVATGRQGIAYLPGTWHHPLLALDAETDFGCVVWEDESDDDNVIVSLPEAARPMVSLAVSL
jgi:ureidoglycolate lyase